MNHSIWTGTCATLVGLATATALFAQQPADANPGKKIKVTGCLRPAVMNTDTAASAAGAAAGTTGTTGTAGTAGTTGTAGTSGDVAQQKFELADAVVADVADAAASTADTTAAASTSKETYQLIANATALVPHVGKKLELTGTIETQKSDAPQPTLRVESGKIVANSCDQK